MCILATGKAQSRLLLHDSDGEQVIIGLSYLPVWFNEQSSRQIPRIVKSVRTRDSVVQNIIFFCIALVFIIDNIRTLKNVE